MKMLAGLVALGGLAVIALLAYLEGKRRIDEYYDNLAQDEDDDFWWGI